MKTLEYLENQFDEKKAITLQELALFLHVSIRTTQRIIRTWDIIRSYDRNGRYFSLERLAKFNSYGIWEFNNIHFSKFGNLRNTLIAVVNNSSQGLDASQIRDILGIDTRSFLFQYKDVNGIKREKFDVHYVYFSSDHERFLGQLSKRRQNLESLEHPPLNGPDAISVLVETIKHPDFTVEELTGHLHKLGIKIKQMAIQDFFEFYGIEKKTNFL